jgi:MFS family permease
MVHRYGRESALAPLQSPCFRLFLIGQSVSVLGSWLQIVAEGWLVYRLTHSPAWLGAVAGAGMLPGLLLTLWGGQIADRCSRRHILMSTSIVGMLLALLLALLASGHWVPIQPWHVVALAAIAGANNAFSGPAFQSFLPELVTRRDVTGAIALHSLLWNGARVVGPLVGAVVIARYGVAACYLLNGLSYIPVLVALTRVRPARASVAVARSSAWEGVRHVRQDPATGRMLALLAVTVCFGWCFQTLLPALAYERFGRGAAGVGALMAAVGVGCALACLATALFTGEADRRSLTYGGAFLYAVALFALAIVPSFVPALVIAAIVGFGLIVCGLNINALLQAWAPDELRGRVMGIFSLLFTALQPLGGLMAGFAAQHVGTAPTVAAAATLCLIATTALFRGNQEEERAARKREFGVALKAA